MNPDWFDQLPDWRDEYKNSEPPLPDMPRFFAGRHNFDAVTLPPVAPGADDDPPPQTIAQSEGA